MGGGSIFTVPIAPTPTDVAAIVPSTSVPFTMTWLPSLMASRDALASRPIFVEGEVVIGTD